MMLGRHGCANALEARELGNTVCTESQRDHWLPTGVPMFYSYDYAETPVGAWLEKGSRSWRFIEWSMDIPWFWVTLLMAN